MESTQDLLARPLQQRVPGPCFRLVGGPLAGISQEDRGGGRKVFSQRLNCSAQIFRLSLSNLALSVGDCINHELAGQVVMALDSSAAGFINELFVEHGWKSKTYRFRSR